MRAALLALALALPGAAAAHDPVVPFVAGYAWFDGPGRPTGSDGRIRLVRQDGHGVAALTENQAYAYALAYRRHLARLSFRMPVRSAHPRAAHAAWHEVVGPEGRAVPASSFDTEPLNPGEFITPYNPFD